MEAETIRTVDAQQVVDAFVRSRHAWISYLAGPPGESQPEWERHVQAGMEAENLLMTYMEERGL